MLSNVGAGMLKSKMEIYDQYSKDEMFCMFLLLSHLKVNRYLNAFEFREFLIRLFVYRNNVDQDALDYFNDKPLVQLNFNKKIISFNLQDFLNFTGYSASNYPFNLQDISVENYSKRSLLKQYPGFVLFMLFKGHGIEIETEEGPSGETYLAKHYNVEFIPGKNDCFSFPEEQQLHQINRIVDQILKDVPESYFEDFIALHVESLQHFVSFKDPNKSEGLRIGKHLSEDQFKAIYRKIYWYRSNEEVLEQYAKAIQDNQGKELEVVFHLEITVLSLAYLYKHEYAYDLSHLEDSGLWYFDLDYDLVVDLQHAADSYDLDGIIEYYNYQDWEELVPELYEELTVI